MGEVDDYRDQVERRVARRRTKTSRRHSDFRAPTFWNFEMAGVAALLVIAVLLALYAIRPMKRSDYEGELRPLPGWNFAD